MYINLDDAWSMVVLLTGQGTSQCEAILSVMEDCDESTAAELANAL